jgi:dehydrogenase/reductase SDR family protein 7B
LSSFAGKVAWVTGASSGIGEALAQALAMRGASLVLSARRAIVLEEVRGLCARPEAHEIMTLDVTEPTSFPAAVERVRQRFGRIDILVNNAGITQRGTAVATPLEIDRRIMEVNFFGPIALTKAVLPLMIERRSGHVVVVSSLLGKFGVAHRSAYAASKHALQGFFDSLRAEVHDAGVAVTLVCPGPVRTSASMNALTADGTPYGMMDEFLKQGLTAEQCAAQILSAIAKKKREIYPARQGRYALLLSRYAPGLFSRLVRKTRLDRPAPNEG